MYNKKKKKKKAQKEKQDRKNERTCVYFSMKTMSKELIPNSSSLVRCLCHVLKTSKRTTKKQKMKNQILERLNKAKLQIKKRK